MVWTLSSGQVIRTGLTMNRTTAHLKRREIERAIVRANATRSAA